MYIHTSFLGARMGWIFERKPPYNDAHFLIYTKLRHPLSNSQQNCSMLLLAVVKLAKLLCTLLHACLKQMRTYLHNKFKTCS